MSSRSARRASAAVRTRALCVLLLLLLQHAWCRLPCPAVAQPAYTVPIKRYMSFPNSVLGKLDPTFSVYTKSHTQCGGQSAYLTADQTDAAHAAISTMLRANRGSSGNALAFLGGDMLYNFLTVTDHSKRCMKNDAVMEANCIYRWTHGRFLSSGNPDFAYGVPFYVGGLYSRTMNRPLNGFKARWASGYPAFPRAFLWGVVLPSITTGSAWYDNYPWWPVDNATAERDLIAICEVQKPTETETLTLSMTPTVTASETLSSTLSATATASLTWSLFSPPLFSAEPDLAQGADSWARQHWWVILLIVLLILIIAVIIVLVFCHLGRRKRKALFASEWKPPLETRDGDLDSNEMAALKKRGLTGRDFALGKEDWSPLEEDAVHVEERDGPAEMDSVELMSPLSPLDAAPSESIAQLGQRQRSTLRSARQCSQRTRRGNGNVFSNITIPECEEIMELYIHDT